MDAELQGYLDTLKEILDETREKVRGLPVEVLNWKPLPEDTNSLAAIVTHMHGVTTFWIYQGLTGEDVKRDRAAEFEAVVSDADEVATLLSHASTRARTAIEGCHPSSLDDVIRLPNNEPCTKREAIIHTIKELGQHLGHMDITRQLWTERG